MTLAPVAVERSPLLRDLAADQRRTVLGAAGTRRLGRGQALFLRDDPARALYMVASGRIRLSQIAGDGREVIVRLAGPGAVFAAIAVLEGTGYPFDAVAAEPSRVLLWERRTLRDLLHRVPALEQSVLRIVASHSREALDRFRELATESVARRVSRALLRLMDADGHPAPGGTLLTGVTRRDLAELSGTTVFTVSRVLSDWETRGLVAGGRGRILVRSREALEQELRRVDRTPARRSGR